MLNLGINQSSKSVSIHMKILSDQNICDIIIKLMFFIDYMGS